MSKALTYAEETLKVHAVYNEARHIATKIDELSTELDVWHDNKRAFQEDIADREAQLIGEERGNHPEMPVTRMEAHLKEVRRSDPELRDLRTKLNVQLGEIQGGEYDLAVLNARLKIAVARMEQLGGYLNYLAAVKLTSQTQANPANPANPGESA